MIIEILTQSETSNEEKASQCGLVGLYSTSTLIRVFVRKRKCPRVTTRRKAKGLETTIRFFSFFLFEEKGCCGRLLFYFKKIRKTG